MKLPEIRRGNPAKEDRLRIDYYLRERQSPSVGPRFDFIPFDATHWPYWFPSEHEVFKPAPLSQNSQHVCVQPPTCKPCAIVIATPAISSTNRSDFNGATSSTTRLSSCWEITVKNSRSVVNLTHAAVLNDSQGRTLLWMHLPDLPPAKISPAAPTTHLDIVPTLPPRSGSLKISFLLKADRCSSNRNVATFLRSAKMVFVSRFTEPSSPVPTFHGGPFVRANIFSLECNGVTESSVGR